MFLWRPSKHPNCVIQLPRTREQRSLRRKQRFLVGRVQDPT